MRALELHSTANLLWTLTLFCFCKYRTAHLLIFRFCERQTRAIDDEDTIEWFLLSHTYMDFGFRAAPALFEL